MTSPSLPAGTLAASSSTATSGSPARGLDVGRQRAPGPADDAAAVADRAADDPDRVRQRVAEERPGRRRPAARRRPCGSRRWCRATARRRRAPARPCRGCRAARRPRRSTTGVPAGRPIRPAAAGASGSVAVVGRICGSCSAETPASAIASGLQARVAMSSRPVPDADDSSVTSVPVSRAQQVVLQADPPARGAPASAARGGRTTCSLVSGVIGCTGTPVRACSSARLPGRRSVRGLLAGARVGPGDQRRQRLQRRRRAPISPCIALLSEIASTSAPPVAATHSASASAGRRRRSPRGPAPAWPGAGCSSGYSRIATRRHDAPRPNAAALTPVVPTSSPTITSARASSRRRAAGSGRRTAATSSSSAPSAGSSRSSTRGTASAQRARGERRRPRRRARR